MVEIFLRVEGRYVRFLSIPLNEIQPLCIRPLKWIRFVAFAICGSRGHLYGSTGEGTRPVDYETSVLTETSWYFYAPNDPFCFIDFQGLNDRVTSTVHTQRGWNFRSQIIARDGPKCIFTLENEHVCEAVHVLPRSKGSEYICKIIRDRSGLYDQQLDVSDIDDIQNGIFMSSNLHKKFAIGAVAFIKVGSAERPLRKLMDCMEDTKLRTGTPRYPNRSSSRRVNPTASPCLHKFTPSNGERYPILCEDANYSPTEDPPPPAILIDYMYGVAAYTRWKHPAIQSIVERYFTDHSKIIPPLQLPGPSDSSHGLDEIDDPRDGDYEDTAPTRGHGHSSRQLAEVMDEMNAFLIYLSGITPQAIAEKWQKEEEETQLEAKEQSQAKVVEWLQGEVNSSDTGVHLLMTVYSTEVRFSRPDSRCSCHPLDDFSASTGSLCVCRSSLRSLSVNMSDVPIRPLRRTLQDPHGHPCYVLSPGLAFPHAPLATFSSLPKTLVRHQFLQGQGDANKFAVSIRSILGQSS